MNLTRSLLLAGVLALAAPVVSASVVAPASAQQPAGVVAPVSALYAALTTLQGQGSSVPFQQRAERLAPAVDQAFNLPTILQTSIGLRFRSLPDAQKQQLEQVFRQFTIARYVSNFATNSGDTLKVLPNPRPSPYGGEQIVQTQIVSSSGTVTKLDYVMRQFPQGWQAVDVLVDGHISQVAVQRSDFGSTVSTGDAAPLIESLKRKIRSFSDT